MEFVNMVVILIILTFQHTDLYQWLISIALAQIHTILYVLTMRLSQFFFIKYIQHIAIDKCSHLTLRTCTCTYMRSIGHVHVNVQSVRSLLVNINFIYGYMLWLRDTWHCASAWHSVQAPPSLTTHHARRSLHVHMGYIVRHIIMHLQINLSGCCSSKHSIASKFQNPASYTWNYFSVNICSNTHTYTHNDILTYTHMHKLITHFLCTIYFNVCLHIKCVAFL